MVSSICVFLGSEKKMEYITVIVLGILFLALAWFAILIFSEKNNRETPHASTGEDGMGAPSLESPPDELGRYQQLMGEYAIMLKKLRKKIQAMEEPSGPPFDDLSLDSPDFLEKTPENTPTPPQKQDLSPSPVTPPVFPMDLTDKLADTQIENVSLRRDLMDQELRTKKLEEEVHMLKKTINRYEEQLERYRDMVRGSEGKFTIINKHNYRLCGKNPETGELEYRLIKLPPDFNPFNPTHITPEGMEIFEEHHLEIPTRLGDIIRKEYSQGEPSDYPPYWPKTSQTRGTDEPIKWEINHQKN